MNIYTRKTRWKVFLFLFAMAIITLTVWYTQHFLRKIAVEEKEKVQIWANAITRKAHLVNYTKRLFDNLRQQERKSVRIWSEATRRFAATDNEEDIKFYTEIISGNDNIPVIVTNEQGDVTAGKNLSPPFDTITHLSPALRDTFTPYPPMKVNYWAQEYIYIYYQNSRLFVQLKHTLDDLVQSFLNEVVQNSLSTPVLILDSTRQHIIAYGGKLDTTGYGQPEHLSKAISGPLSQNEPIVVHMPGYGLSYIYYEDSALLTQLRYFPMILFGLIALFLFIAYIMFSLSRNAEQNQVWAGMAKESAHQLGTPISSLMGWIELLKSKEESKSEAQEMEKDLVRLQQVSERFSKIGSKPELEEHDLIVLIQNTIDYMARRSSRKIHYHFHHKDRELTHRINPLLFSWVLENLIKNALDAIEGQGDISVHVERSNGQVIVDVSDSGKGIPKSRHKTIFNPGYSTKSRGWGLGLSLARRIIKDYHRGQIFVKNSSETGTTIRIILS